MSRQIERNARREKFIDLAIEYEKDNTRAYKEAYDIPDNKKETARVGAYELLQNPTIALRVKEGIAEKRKRREKLREKAEEKAIIREVLTREGAMLILTEIAQGHAPLNIGGKLVLENKRDRIAAIVQLSKMEGWESVQKVEVTTNISNLEERIDALFELEEGKNIENE